MALIESLLFALAPAIAKAIRKAWLNQSTLTSLADPVIDALTKHSVDQLKQRQQQQQIATIAQQVADGMKPFFDREAAGLPDHERNAPVMELASTLEQVRVDINLLITCQFQSERVNDHLRDARPTATRPLSHAQSALYERLLRETSRALVTLAPSLDGFTGSIAIATLHDVNDVRKIVSEQLRQRDEAAQQLEQDYRASVADQLDRMDYFGIRQIDLMLPRQPLTDAYMTLQYERRLSGQKRRDAEQLVSPERRVRSTTDKDDERQRIIQSGPVDLLLADARWLVILSEAGGGKSTLLRWIAVRAARRDFPAPLAALNDSVPFFIRLRERVGQEFPTPSEMPGLVARNLNEEIPTGWARQQLRTGRALVLVDGVDELPRDQRTPMLERLDQLVREYPLARYIITSRPSALKAGEWPEWAAWIEQVEFVEASLQPLDTAQIEHLIDRWHTALAPSVCDTVERAELEGLPAKLKRRLQQRPALRRLATNPLLCAMLCALHRERGASLPVERIKLYDECVEMLLERRDERRGIVHDPTYPKLGYEQKLALLKSFALWLMRNGSSDVECDEVDEHFARELPSLGIQTTGERVRAFFVDRGALLREPVEGRIDFTHRTFQEYLAAQAALEENSIRELLNYARDDQWRETIILAVGKARPQECDWLLRELIDRGKEPSKHTHRQQMHLLAVACLETAVRVSPEVRTYVLDQATALFPPQDMDAARLVAAVGDPAVPLLRYNPQYNIRQAADCVRALLFIGSDAALQAIAGYADHSHWLVKEEIGRAWTAFDRTEYAQRVLRHMQAVRLPFFPSIEQVILLPHVTKLVISGDSEAVDLAPLTHLPNLAQLTLSSLRQLSDLTPLAQIPTLTHLILTDLPQLNDLAPLAQISTLTDLTLDLLPQLNDLAPLIRFPSLTQLTLSSLRQISDLTSLAALTTLQELRIGGKRMFDFSPLEGRSDLKIIRME